MQTYNANGIVLRRLDYRENDRLFVIYTEEYGKLEVIARGTKKILSKLNPHLEPFNQVKVMIAKGRGFDKLGNAIAINDFSQVKNSNNLYLLSVVHYILEVTEKFVPHRQPDFEIFNNLYSFLTNLDQNLPQTHDLNSLYFLGNGYVLKLLDQLGYRPELVRCVECTRGVLFPNATVFDFLRGGLVCESCKPITLIHEHYEISDSVIKIFNLILAENYQTLQNFRFGESDMKDFNAIIAKILEYQLERKINSLEFLKAIC